LNKRIEYLSRAVVCVKSGEATSASDASGDILHNLEEKMEVARVQVSLALNVEKNMILPLKLLATDKKWL
jgi:nuclear pore complex protein Nup155